MRASCVRGARTIDAERIDVTVDSIKRYYNKKKKKKKKLKDLLAVLNRSRKYISSRALPFIQ
ncbi:hypothetical protein PUN28_004809 [Cardiocondyla obscurior]|uniref:Ribosomal protein S13 n=1 Tax=Cardiocondyla obscurior TaxID=286306 RepID=A0AAW2GCQ1_9HYME